MIYTEDQKKIRDAAGMMCLVAMGNPNTIMPEKFRPWATGYIKDDEPVRAWMLFIGTVETASKRKEQQKLKDEGQDKATLKQRAYLTKMIEISNPGQQHEYWK